MNQIDQPPLSTPLPVINGQVQVDSDPAWSKWFGQIYAALFRPTVSQSCSFPAVGAGKSSDVTLNFPSGTVALTDIPVLGAPTPPDNCAFMCFVSAADTVKIRLLNAGSSATVAYTGTFAVTVLNN